MNEYNYKDVKHFLQNIFYHEIVFSYEDVTEALITKIIRADRELVVRLMKFCDYALGAGIDNEERQRLWIYATGGDYEYGDQELYEVFKVTKQLAQKELQRRSVRSSLVKRKK